MLVAYAVTFCLAFTAAVLFAPLVRVLAVRVGAMDLPDGRRKIHTKPTPRLGGLVIAAAILCAAALYYMLSPNVTDFVFATPTKIAGFAGGLAIVLGLGVWDDIKAVKPRTKLAFQTLAVLVCYSTGLKVDLPWIPNAILAGILSFILTWFWFVACINSMNLVDGMDGLASGVAFFAGLVIFVVAAFHMKSAVALAAATVLGSVVGFLMYNFHPAVMFLGDSGSLLLGYLIAILAIAGSLKSHATAALLVPILALGLPIMDTLLAILRRVSRRLPISQADRGHIHHRLLAMGLTDRQAVLVLYGACLTLAAGALVVASAGSLAVGLMLGLLCIGAALAVRLLGAGEFVELLRQLAAGGRSQLDTTLFWLNQAQSYDDVGLALEPWLKSVGVAAATIRTDGPAGKVLVKVRIGEAAQDQRYCECTLVIAPGRSALLVLQGASLSQASISENVRFALSGALIRIGQRGNRDTIASSGADRFAEGLVARSGAGSR